MYTLQQYTKVLKRYKPVSDVRIGRSPVCNIKLTSFHTKPIAQTHDWPDIHLMLVSGRAPE